MEILLSEILTLILSLLPTRQLYESVPLVCKRFWELVSLDNLYLWRLAVYHESGTVLPENVSTDRENIKMLIKVSTARMWVLNLIQILPTAFINCHHSERVFKQSSLFVDMVQGWAVYIKKPLIPNNWSFHDALGFVDDQVSNVFEFAVSSISINWEQAQYKACLLFKNKITGENWRATVTKDNTSQVALEFMKRTLDQQKFMCVKKRDGEEDLDLTKHFLCDKEYKHSDGESEGNLCMILTPSGTEHKIKHGISLKLVTSFLYLIWDETGHCRPSCKLAFPLFYCCSTLDALADSLFRYAKSEALCQLEKLGVPSCHHPHVKRELDDKRTMVKRHKIYS